VEKIKVSFSDQRKIILSSLDRAHDVFYLEPVFDGPSLHFHLRALEAVREQKLEAFSELVYATLVSWGMHRMGRSGSKMTEFGVFANSIRTVWPKILRLQGMVPHDLRQTDWEDLREIFKGLSCMASGTSLVGNSKVMAHALPNLVAPIDRRYTLMLLFGNGSIVNNIDAEWETLKEIHQGFFYPILDSGEFKNKYSEWCRQAGKFRWDSSPLKVIDNLIIGTLRLGTARQARSNRRPTASNASSTGAAGREKRSKYDTLRDFLKKRSETEVTLLFSQAPEILGFALPASATKYQAFWANQSNTTVRPWAKAWQDAGFRVESYRLGEKDGWVRFKRGDA